MIYSNFSGWSDDGTEFYIHTLATNADGVKYKVGDGYYEIYKIDNDK